MPPEPSTIKSLLEILLKPFALIFNPIAERIGNKFKRKPKLFFHVNPLTSIWCYAWEGTNNPMMQVRFDANITNDGEHEAVIIVDGYVEGTKSKFPLIRPIRIESRTMTEREIICVFVTPVVGEGGKDFTGRIILIDQLKRKHPTDKLTFKWVGPTEHPTQPRTP